MENIDGYIGDIEHWNMSLLASKHSPPSKSD